MQKHTTIDGLYFNPCQKRCFVLGAALALVQYKWCIYNVYAVRVFTHGVMGRRIDPSWGGPIEL